VQHNNPKSADPVTSCGGCAHQGPPSAIAGLLLALGRRRA
jgi:hypothetical protein